VQYILSAEGGPEGEVVGEDRILAEEGAARIHSQKKALRGFSAEGCPEREVVGEERILAEEGAARILHAHHALTLPIKACATVQG
jgi:hypothetical protein